MLCIGLLLIISLHSKSKPKNKPLYSLEVLLPQKNENEENPFYSEDSVYIDGDFYIPSDAIAKLTDFTMTLNEDVVGLVFKDSGEFAKFKIDSLNATVNGNEIELTQNAKYIDGILYLPYEFYKAHVIGFDIDFSEDKLLYTISRTPDSNPSFLLKKPHSTNNQSESDKSTASDSPIDFVLDLSAYEQYMNPEDRDEYLFLVNSDNRLDENYIPNDLLGTVFTRDDGRATQKLRKYACYALEAFLKEAEANGCDNVTVTSGYRSYEYQSQLFQNEINITGSVEAASKNVNPPGSSEHQSGLCVDMHNLSSASVAFADTDEAVWLENNAYKFGYILRYPKNKVSVTGISYEPWHFRYVGRYHATKMHELGMCLEEYIEYVNS
jgi:LAS superfamily LD-carboxypeptidase LdcB